VQARIEKKLSGQKGKHLLYGDRLVLINYVLSSLHMFMMSLFEVPRGILKKIEYFRSRFFGNMMNTKRNINWQSGIFCVSQKNKVV
jgi:hypothetical protein